MIWECGTKSLRKIGEIFCGLAYAAVAQGFAGPDPRTPQGQDPISSQKC